MRRSLLRRLLGFACSPAMAAHTPSGPGALPTGQVGGIRSGLAPVATAEVEIKGPRCVSQAYSQNCLQDLDVAPAPERRDVA